MDSYRYGADLVRLGQPRVDHSQQTEDEKGIVLQGLVYRILANANKYRDQYSSSSSRKMGRFTSLVWLALSWQMMMAKKAMVQAR